MFFENLLSSPATLLPLFLKPPWLLVPPFPRRLVFPTHRSLCLPSPASSVPFSSVPDNIYSTSLSQKLLASFFKIPIFIMTLSSSFCPVLKLFIPAQSLIFKHHFLKSVALWSLQNTPRQKFWGSHFVADRTEHQMDSKMDLVSYRRAWGPHAEARSRSGPMVFTLASPPAKCLILGWDQEIGWMGSDKKSHSW